ncbi:MAG: DAK2 domain-containing protein [Anaerolineae bacterium]|nr:DAK2 domain-containing protein [Anaerolineae bacterium]
MGLDSPKTQRRLTKFPQAAVDGQSLKRLVKAGLDWLRTNQEIVNALNVFPVPDGDTGTNMVLTMQSALDEISELSQSSFTEIATALSQGALMGARGNSGVILSQLWRGFSRSLQGQAVLDGPGLVKAFAEARDTAYKGGARPVEGTILTVAKDIAKAADASLKSKQDLVEILVSVVKEADESVKRTPDLLPVLKESGVVDAGGKGLFFILEGMLRYINGEPLDTPLVSVQSLSAMSFESAMQEIEEGQDFEVVVDFRPHKELDLEKFYAKLEELGTSIQMAEGENMYRMHIHVPLENRYLPIDYIMELGTITKVAMENLAAQMDEIDKKAKGDSLVLTNTEFGQIAVVTVSPGPGLSRIFASLGVAAIVEGGQTKNPSTKELLAAFEDLPTESIILLPNNKNIILAANQAKKLSAKNVEVVPSLNAPQGFSAMLALNPDSDLEIIVKKMNKSMTLVNSGEITIATRSVEIEGVKVKEGQVIGLLDGKLVCSEKSVERACLKILKKANAKERELITLYYGEDLPETDAKLISNVVQEAYEGQEIELQNGGQPQYQLIISVE